MVLARGFGRPQSRIMVKANEETKVKSWATVAVAGGMYRISIKGVLEPRRPMFTEFTV